MARLSSPIENIRDYYQIVVVGSGYGGGIAAARLAQVARSVCVLERGKELHPGEYPDTSLKALRETQASLPDGRHCGSPTGLYDFRINKDISVFVGCGLGGTSLINANVCLCAAPGVFDNQWPQELRSADNQLPPSLKKGYLRATEMLRPTRYPGDTSLPKLQALEKSAKALGKEVIRPPLSVTFTTCTLCGNCVSGCNEGAKNTVLRTYLPDAQKHGAEIYTQVAVKRVEQQGKQWLVHYEVLGAGREHFAAQPLFLRADFVILAAGTLGSTEILLRSREASLPLSNRLGDNFTGNGDALGFGYSTEEINGISRGRLLDKDSPVGPCITGMVDLREKGKDKEASMVIQEGSIPGVLSAHLPLAFALSEALRDTRGEHEDMFDRLIKKARVWDKWQGNEYEAEQRHVQTYLVMTHDDGRGRLLLENDRLRIHWPGVGMRPIFDRVDERLKKATGALKGGVHIKSPAWGKLTKWGGLMDSDLITVHPLGGCVIADDAEKGVVNHMGQVFSGTRGTEVYKNLYVCDGSVVPSPLGVNPLFTISALAERCCTLLIKEHRDKWRSKHAPRQEHTPGLRFTERMTGYFSTTVKDDFRKGAEQGQKDSSSCELTLTIVFDEGERFGHGKRSPEEYRCRAKMIGNATAPALSSYPLIVREGTFTLFPTSVEEPGARLIRYEMVLITKEGRRYYCEAEKMIRSDSGLTLWSAVTTANFTLHEDSRKESPVLGKGVLKVHPSDFLKQLSTLRVSNTDKLEKHLRATTEFARFFAGTVSKTVAGDLDERLQAAYEAFSSPGIFSRFLYRIGKSIGVDLSAQQRQRRSLRTTDGKELFGEPVPFTAPASEEQRKRGDDRDVDLLLTHYSKGGRKYSEGGRKGPVILSPGFGMSSRMFALNTIKPERSLVEYLCDEDYDVWLLDYRASPNNPVASRTQFAIDDIATKDYPAAVDTVLQETEAKTVQVVAHCVGSMALLMALLADGARNERLRKQVRSAICSQVSTHPDAGRSSEIKAGLYMASILADLGLETLTARYDETKWKDWLLEQLFKRYQAPEELCSNPVCRRILFLYGETHRHDQLDDEAHDTIEGMFGTANLSALKHLSLMLRKDYIINAKGENVYLRNIERLKDIRITFIHGAENRIFLPSGTEQTYKLLCEKNPEGYYSRYVIPNYAHLDCFIGKNAARDVFPLIHAELEKWSRR